MVAYHPYRTSVTRDEHLRAIADAVLIVNAALCELKPTGFTELDKARDDCVRRIQGHLLEAYRVTMDVPFERFYNRNEEDKNNGRHSDSA